MNNTPHVDDKEVPAVETKYNFVVLPDFETHAVLEQKRCEYVKGVLLLCSHDVRAQFNNILHWRVTLGTLTKPFGFDFGIRGDGNELFPWVFQGELTRSGQYF